MSIAMDGTDEFGAMTVKEFGGRYRLGHTKIYELIKDGKLRAVKCGTRTLILRSDAKAFERTLSPSLFQTNRSARISFTTSIATRST